MGRRPALVICVVMMMVRMRDAQPCAPAPPAGERVYIAEEEAIITWDPTTKLEHFIRRAAFQSTAASFGFLVPTPTVPKLGEVSAHTLDMLAETTAPETRYDDSGVRFEFGMLVSSCMKMGERSAAPAPVGVQVLATAHVAGFDAVTIAADNPDTMASWLAEHGFAKTPELTEWLARYVEAHWTITAFVVAKDDKAASDIATSAVVMSFTTDRPFYPYREPRASDPATELAPGSRRLRMFFLGDARYAATLVNAPWSAPIAYAAPLPSVPKELEPFVGAHPFATVFVDDSYPRNGIDEVYFARDTEQREIRPAPIVIAKPTEVFIPVDVVVVLAIIALLVVRSVRKRWRANVGRL